MKDYQNPDCPTCEGACVVIRPPFNKPEPCPDCTGKAFAHLRAAAPDETVVVPVMSTMAELVIVDKPEAAMGNVPESKCAISVGPGTLMGNGVLHIAFHAKDGEVLVATMAAAGMAKFSAMINEAARRLQSGEFDATPAGASVQ